MLTVPVLDSLKVDTKNLQSFIPVEMHVYEGLKITAKMSLVQMSCHLYFSAQLKSVFDRS